LGSGEEAVANFTKTISFKARRDSPQNSWGIETLTPENAPSPVFRAGDVLEPGQASAERRQASSELISMTFSRQKPGASRY
jgi:hypothetical protein